MAYGLLTNSFTQFYPWTDYFGQYVTMAYDFHDTWRNFFRTGFFELYSDSTYLGSDNIGSNSYYGLFDPFLFVCYIFPRAWVPQTFAFATILKGICGAFATRAYLRYLGVSESSSRIGGLAFAFNGYINFMVGFPSFVSMAFTVPLVFLGIERTLKERKIGVLALGLALLGMISFFFLVVVCIFGVLYAIWRFFQTLKTRNAKENVTAMAFGVLGFAIGISLSAWTLFPSLRESALSGRTTSLGKAYLNYLLSSFKDFDIGTVFSLLFEMVGRHPVREMQALIGFFYPTIGYKTLPLAGSGYDAWTASIFCYTPFILLTFIALTSSARRKKWSHLALTAIFLYLLFTNFAYYFFYAFTGDGYGRWYIVLVPIVIYYGAQELDRLKNEPKWVIATGEGIAFGLTVLTWALCVALIRSGVLNTALFSGDTTYWQSVYNVPYTYTEDGIERSCLWIVYIQLIFLAVESVAILLFQKRKILPKILMSFVAIETVLWGNMSFTYCGTWRVNDLTNSSGKVISSGWNGGNEYRETATEAMEYINSKDPSYFRTFMEGTPESNSAMAFGSAGTSNFHSLFNYDVNQLSLYIGANRAAYARTSPYDNQVYYSQGWSAFYGNKRLGTDIALGIKYYAVYRQGYGEDWELQAKNVPWGSTPVEGYGDNYASVLRFYESPLAGRISLGHAVDNVYKQNLTDSATGADSFYSGSLSYSALLRNDAILLKGAIISDSDWDEAQNDIAKAGLSRTTVHNEAPESYASDGLLTSAKNVSYSMTCYKADYAWWGPTKEGGGHEGPTYLFEDVSKMEHSIKNSEYYIADKETVVLTPKDGSDYFNDDPTGAYFSISFELSNYTKTRIYMIGDTFDEDGNLKETDVLLSYDYQTMSTFLKRRVSSTGSNYVFGFYPEGKVKYICFNAKPSDYNGNNTTQAVKVPSYINLQMVNRKDIERIVKAYSTDTDYYALQNVQYDKNTFTFDTSFKEDRLVVTTIGYDAGWSAYQIKDDGSRVPLPVYKVNGGFVGVLCPSGDASYVLTYQTPYLKEGVIFAIVGAASLSATCVATFVYRLNKKRKSMQNAD